MDGFTDSMIRLTDAFAKMPGIGRKTAERLTYYVLRSNESDMHAMVQAVLDVKTTVRHCSVCHNITEADPCTICADTRRDHHLVCVVEDPKDLFAIEGTSVFRGVYHVLMGHIAPLENVGPDELTIQSLIGRCKDGTVQEVIMATNPTLEGDGTALYIRKQLEPLGVTVTRLARGLSAGASIEHANPAILTEALGGRINL
jgi:recombination protein RecR